jgi:PAT family beta-lactamase induction signal transducer AmpG
MYALGNPMKTNYRSLHAVLGWCNLTLAATSIYIYLGIPLMMREHGWSGTQIGLFQVSGLPVVLKFLLAAPMDKFRFRTANYLKWAGLLFVAYLVCLLVFALLAGTVAFQLLFFSAVAMTLVTTWLDVPVNAFVIRRLPEPERAEAGAIRSSATALASVLGGGLMLLIYARWGWAWPFYMLVAMALMGALMMFWAHQHFPEHNHQENETNKKVTLLGMWKSYFQRPKMLRWNATLMLYFPFIGAAWLYLKPTLLDLGVEVSEIAWLSACAGLVASLASLIYAKNIKRLSPYSALFIFSLVNVMALFTMFLITQNGWLDWRLTMTIMLVAIGLGLSSGVLFGLVMQKCRVNFSASDYGVQTSLFSLSRILIPISAGLILDIAGYSIMYLALAFAALLVSILCGHILYKGDTLYSQRVLRG